MDICSTGNENVNAIGSGFEALISLSLSARNDSIRSAIKLHRPSFVVVLTSPGSLYFLWRCSKSLLPAERQTSHTRRLVPPRSTASIHATIPVSIYFAYRLGSIGTDNRSTLSVIASGRPSRSSGR
ncbi:hypothetical protein VN97_g4268 [Penicillium thymicola]|uniref:Uncharacterized protein n=1 Tax=Penicillium thymicola TaxID=293382 RepID=A0AAI9TKV0_PENTH|nr:hypothetical protein VN97_g4268 [Penicillium thymicola]